MKLKFKKDYAGCYIGTETYKGYEVEVTLQRFVEGGFGYTINVNGSYSYGDGWIGLRKSDILDFIDESAMWCVNEVKVADDERTEERRLRKLELGA